MGDGPGEPMRRGGPGDAWTDRSLIHPLAGFGAPLRGFGYTAEQHARHGQQALVHLQSVLMAWEAFRRESTTGVMRRVRAVDLLVRISEQRVWVQAHRDSGAADAWSSPEKHAVELALRSATAAVGRLKGMLEE